MKRLRVIIAVFKAPSSPTLLLGATLIFACLSGCRAYEREPPYYCSPGCCAPCQPYQPAATTYAPPVRATSAAPCYCQ